MSDKATAINLTLATCLPFLLQPSGSCFHRLVLQRISAIRRHDAHTLCRHPSSGVVDHSFPFLSKALILCWAVDLARWIVGVSEPTFSPPRTGEPVGPPRVSHSELLQTARYFNHVPSSYTGQAPTRSSPYDVYNLFSNHLKLRHPLRPWVSVHCG